jgi:cytochrome c biogenesis protein CcdA
MASPIELKFVTVLVTALVDSINPCAIGVLVLLVSTLLALSKDRMKMLMVGVIYIVAVYITYLLAGLGLIYFITKLQVAALIGTIVGFLIITLGFVDMKDFFWYGKGITLGINPKHAQKIKKMIKKVSIPGAVILGIFVAAVELPCTGGPYLAITALLAKDFNATALYYLIFYNFIFVLPLIIIVAMAYFGTNMKKVQKWKTKHRKWMRLANGLIMVTLGYLLVLYAVGIIKL